MVNWSATSIEFLKERFQYELSASTTKKCPCNEAPLSLCTFLWKRVEEENDPLSPSRPKWINVNRELFNEGLAHKTGDMLIEAVVDFDFSVPEDKKTIADNWNHIDLKFRDKDHENNDKVNLDGPILIEAGLNQYIKPEQIPKTVFTGYPTYVDHEAVIYLHDDEGKKYIDQINFNIENFLKSPEWTKHELNTECNNDKWQPGLACLARFHFDKKYYRAEIVSILENDVAQVRFVDYGNIEECPFAELLYVCVYSMVPIQARKYKLYGIKPVNNESHHANNVLDTMHKIVVEKICQIRVETKVSFLISLYVMLVTIGVS